MANKKTVATKPVNTYTARAEDLKILGYVEAANEKEAITKARKQYGARSVELREEAKSGGDQPAAEGPAEEPPTKSKKAAKGKKAAESGEAETIPETPKGNPKPKRRRGSEGEPKEKKVSAIDAAARVLAEAGQPMNCQEMIAAMAEKGYWKSPGGLTPAATLYSALLREISKKGADSRFQKTERGKFARTETV